MKKQWVFFVALIANSQYLFACPLCDQAGWEPEYTYSVLCISNNTDFVLSVNGIWYFEGWSKKQSDSDWIVNPYEKLKLSHKQHRSEAKPKHVSFDWTIMNPHPTVENMTILTDGSAQNYYISDEDDCGYSKETYYFEYGKTEPDGFGKVLYGLFLKRIPPWK